MKLSNCTAITKNTITRAISRSYESSVFVLPSSSAVPAKRKWTPSGRPALAIGSSTSVCTFAIASSKGIASAGVSASVTVLRRSL